MRRAGRRLCHLLACWQRVGLVRGAAGALNRDLYADVGVPFRRANKERPQQTQQQLQKHEAIL